MHTYKFKDYGNGNVEVKAESLKGTSFSYLAVRCSDPIMHNMTDTELAEDDEKYNGDGREIKFNIFINANTCLRFTYDLYGLDVHFTLSPKIDNLCTMFAVNEVLIVVNEYFKDKLTTDISKAFYKRFETDILVKILDHDNKRTAA